jgi:hypothetical protein
MPSIEYKLCKIDEREYSFAQCSKKSFAWAAACVLKRGLSAETDRNSDPTLKKKVIHFPVSSRDVTNQTRPGQE